MFSYMMLTNHLETVEINYYHVFLQNPTTIENDYIDNNCSQEFIRITKPGSLIVFTVRNNLTNQAYIAELNEIVAAMEKANLWTKIKCFEAEQYGLDLASLETDKKTPLFSLVYCYQKV